MKVVVKHFGYMHNPTSVLENDTYNPLWDLDIQKDHIISGMRPEGERIQFYTIGLCRSKPVKLRLKIDLVLYPALAEGLVNMYRVWLFKTFLFQAIQFSQKVLIQPIQLSISIVFVHTQLNIKTVLYQTIQFSVSTVSMSKTHLFQTIPLA